MLSLLAQADGLLLGEDFLPWMVLAFGAALVVGNGLALVRPPGGKDGDDSPHERERPPVARVVVLMVIGAVAAAWGAASLIA